MAEYEIDFGFGMTQRFGKPSPTGDDAPEPSGFISDMSDPDRYRKMADSLRQDWLSRTAPAAGSLSGAMATGSGRLPSQPPINAYGNDLTQANRFSAMADSMKQERLAYSAPQSGSLGSSMTPAVTRTDTRTWGDIGQMPAFRPVSNVGAMGGNF